MMAELMSEGHYLEMCPEPTTFDPVSKITNVCFDESNKQIFSIRSGGATGVVVNDLKGNRYTFLMEDRGAVQAIRFSPDIKIVAVQRSQMSVEFINYTGNGTDTIEEYSQSCKAKTAKILGFIWTGSAEVVFVTDQGIEQYQVNREKRSLKLMKNVNMVVNWFVYLADHGVLLLSSSVLGNVFHPFTFKSGTMTRLPKFEVDLPVIPKPLKLCLFHRDVSIANLYDQLFIIVLRQQPKGPGHMTPAAEVVLYQILKESPARKTDVLKLNMSGRFAISTIDNLVVVHHQTSHTSMIFDIKLGGKSDGYVNYHFPVLSPLAIKTFISKVQEPSLASKSDTVEIHCEMYSANWVMFHPNIIIDPRLGFMWSLNLCMDNLISMMSDKSKLVEFLLLRRESKMVVLSVCRQALTPGHQCNLAIIAVIFDQLNAVYKRFIDTESPQTGLDTRPDTKSMKPQNIIDPSDMYTHVLSVFADNQDIKHKFLVAVLVEYIRSLTELAIDVPHYLYELVINTLVAHKAFYQLHQFLQYHVVRDSKPLACLMLSLESTYPPAYQLALDMLKRLKNANEEIIEVLMSKKQLLTALRFVRNVGMVDSVPARKFLEAARNTDDEMLFYTVFKFFEQRNLRNRGAAKFTVGEHCEEFVQHFIDWFGEESLDNQSITDTRG